MITLTFALFQTYSLNAQTVQNFVLKDLQNKNFSFEELKGEKLTIIDFWASWCKPCMKAVPELNKIYSSSVKKGVNIIGVNCDGPRSASKVGPLTKALKIEYPVLIDINSQLMKELNLSAFPTLIIVNPAGKIVWIHEGYVPGDEKIIQAEIDNQLELLK